jgi:hypothetical protein
MISSRITNLIHMLLIAPLLLLLAVESGWAGFHIEDDNSIFTGNGKDVGMFLKVQGFILMLLAVYVFGFHAYRFVKTK